MARLSADHLEFLADQGYLVVPNVLDDGDLAPVRDEFANALDDAARTLHATGELSAIFADLPFGLRYLAVLREYPDLYRFLNISLPLTHGAIDPEAFRCHTGPALFDLLRHPKILDVVESVIGGEILSNPIQHIRLKPPLREVPDAVAAYSNIGRTTWHQDHGAAMDEAEGTDMLTVWVAMTDASVEMGCLVAAPTSHRAGTLTMHCPGDGLGSEAENYIPRGIVDGKPTVALPVTAGSLVLLTKWTEHAALDNTSDTLRWSFDLRYQPIGQPSGRPAFPTFVARSRSHPESEMTDPRAYAAQWDEAREAILTGAHQGPIYEQDRWTANAGDPLCA